MRQPERAGTQKRCVCVRRVSVCVCVCVCVCATWHGCRRWEELSTEAKQRESEREVTCFPWAFDRIPSAVQRNESAIHRQPVRPVQSSSMLMSPHSAEREGEREGEGEGEGEREKEACEKEIFHPVLSGRVELSPSLGLFRPRIPSCAPARNTVLWPRRTDRRRGERSAEEEEKSGGRGAREGGCLQSERREREKKSFIVFPLCSLRQRTEALLRSGGESGTQRNEQRKRRRVRAGHCGGRGERRRRGKREGKGGERRGRGRGENTLSSTFRSPPSRPCPRSSISPWGGAAARGLCVRAGAAAPPPESAREERTSEENGARGDVPAACDVA